MMCPVCGSTDFREARQCPLQNGEPVCIDCCKKCRYYSADTLTVACRYSIEHPHIDLNDELKKINQVIETKEKQINYYYRNNKPWIAQRIEAALSWQYAKKRELEEEIRNGREKENN